MISFLAPCAAALAGGLAVQIVLLRLRYSSDGHPEPFTADDRKALLEAVYERPTDLSVRRGPLGQTEDETRLIAAADVHTHDEGPVITEMVLRCRAYVDAWDGKPLPALGAPLRQLTPAEVDAKFERKAAEALGLDKLQTTCRDGHIMEWGSPQCVICGDVDGRCPDCGEYCPERVDRDRRIRKYKDSGHWPDTWCPTCVGVPALLGGGADIPIPLRSDPSLMSQVNATPREARNFERRREAVLAPVKTYIPFGTAKIQLYKNMEEAMQHARDYRDELLDEQRRVAEERERSLAIINSHVQPTIVLPASPMTEIESGSGLYGHKSDRYCGCGECHVARRSHGRPPNTGSGSKR